MITPSFSLTATERVLPRLALDFTTASLDPRITFTRALNTATVTNSSGNIVLVNADTPRFDYLNGVCQGLLIEESRTNLFLNSIFDGAVAGTPGTAPTSWPFAFTGGSVVSVGTSLYTGGNNIRLSASANRQVIAQSFTAAANTTYSITLRVTIHSGTLEFNNAISLISPPAGATATYQLNGATAVGNETLPVGLNVLRIFLAIVATAGTPTVRIGIGTGTNRTANATFDTPQVEAGAFATSYIPTTTTALTRNADVATMTGTNFSNWYNASEGTAQAQFIFASEPGYSSGGSSQRIFEFSDGSTNNRWLMYRNESVSDRIYYLDASGGSLVVNTSADTTNTTNNTVYKAAMTAKNSSFAAAFNGNTPATFSSGNISTGVNQLFLGKALSNGYLNGWLQKFSYYPQRLTNAEVQAISK